MTAVAAWVWIAAAASAQVPLDVYEAGLRNFSAEELPAEVDRLAAEEKKQPDAAEFPARRGSVLALLGKRAEAVAAYTRSLELRPGQPAVVYRRGSERLRLGRVDESLADFDRLLEIAPAYGPQLWQRGIALYFAGRYDEGRKQFESYQGVDDNDVENVVWRAACMARAENFAVAQKALLPVRRDERVPLMEIHRLFAGAGTVENVLDAVKAGSPDAEELNRRRLYARLYLGLYFDARGETNRAREELTRALEHKDPMYMYDMIRVHLDHLPPAAPAPGEAKK